MNKKTTDELTKVINELEKKYKVYHANGVSLETIEVAEKELQLSFSEEYKTYLSLYGAISFSSHEFTGLGVNGYLNVVHATKKERSLDDNFPKNCILIENTGIDGILILQDKSGKVYSYENRKNKEIAPSLKFYFESI